MRLVYALLGGITLALASSGVLAVPNQERPKDAKLQYLRVDTMQIGIAPAVPDRDGAQPIEVQLHVSDDQGKHWKNTLAVDPGEKRFVFKAPHDGEYWFMPRTKYPGNMLLPNESPRPTSRVMIDTVPPTLELLAKRGDGGEIHVHWDATDANLDPTTLKISYQTQGADTSWREVALDEPPAGTKGNYRGEVDVVPHDIAGQITLRAKIKDLADNEMTTERLVKPLETATDRRGQRTTRDKVTRWEPVPSERFQGQKPDDEQRPADGPPSGISAHYPADAPDAEPIAPGKPTPDRRHRLAAAAGKPDAEEIPTPRRDGHRTVAGQVRQPTGPQYLKRGTEDNDVLDEDFQGELLPSGVRPHFVNTREFEMMYDVEEVGSSGVARVELWATHDGGRNWESFGEDDDCQSPMLVEVDDEGTYGFRVVIENGAGRRGLAPKPGDQPDVWVGVDLTKPRARLISAEQGAGEEAGELVITWEADDERLAARPIALAFSDSPGGPWTTIASGLKNTGSYPWRLDRRVAEQIYLRLEVRDEAQNVTTIESPDPVMIDRARPQGRIRDIRARDESAVRPRRIQNLMR
ncbi:MAG TPA: hypothetical protein VND64_15655 [Pirellulales bacterium]|nr:hypothetical protein [Pirellulales bacterium]